MRGSRSSRPSSVVSDQLRAFATKDASSLGESQIVANLQTDYRHDGVHQSRLCVSVGTEKCELTLSDGSLDGVRQTFAFQNEL